MIKDGFVEDVDGPYDPLGRGATLIRDHERQGRTGLLITGKFG